MILADENIDKRLIKTIREKGIEVFSVYEECRGIDDFSIIQLSKNPPRIILTNDKDFGEWVFAHHEKNISVILLRYSSPEIEQMKAKLTSFLMENKNKIKNKFTTITINHIRTREL